jgi:hypothetical protein
MTVSLGAGDLEAVLTELERELSAQGVPTARRLRAAMLAEELFCALREAADGVGQLSCSFPRPRTVTLQYRLPDGALTPDLRMLRRLNRDSSAYGVNARFHEGRCTITVSG